MVTEEWKRSTAGEFDESEVFVPVGHRTPGGVVTRSGTTNGVLGVYIRPTPDPSLANARNFDVWLAEREGKRATAASIEELRTTLSPLPECGDIVRAFVVNLEQIARREGRVVAHVTRLGHIVIRTRDGHEFVCHAGDVEIVQRGVDR